MTERNMVPTDVLAPDDVLMKARTDMDMTTTLQGFPAAMIPVIEERFAITREMCEADGEPFIVDAETIDIALDDIIELRVGPNSWRRAARRWQIAQGKWRETRDLSAQAFILDGTHYAFVRNITRTVQA